MTLTLNNFISRAEQAARSNQAETTFLNVRGGELSETGRLGNLFTAQATRRDAINAFMKALSYEYGDHVADMINGSQLVTNMRSEARPLTARTVLDLNRLAEKEKERVNKSNLDAVNRFLGNGDQGENLEKAIDILCANHGLSDAGDRERLRDSVRTFLLDKARQGGFFSEVISGPGNPERLSERVQISLLDRANHRGGFSSQGSQSEYFSRDSSPLEVFTVHEFYLGVVSGASKYTGFPKGYSPALNGKHPGAAMDRLRLVEMGLDEKSLSFQRSLAELEAMRRIQPDGDIRLETVYKALFKENDLPPHLDVETQIQKHLRDNAKSMRSMGERILDVENLKLGVEKQILDAIKTRCEDDKNYLLARVGDKSELFLPWAARMPWKRLVSLAERPDTVTLADVADGVTLMWRGKEQEDRDVVERNLLKDPPLVGVGQPRDLPPPMFSFKLREGEGGTTSIQVGPQTNFHFDDDPDFSDYSMGNYDSLARRLKELCVEICDQDVLAPQVTRVMNCLTREALQPLKDAAVLAGARFDENANVSVSLSRSPDGSIRADFSSPEEARDKLGHFSMSLSIARDGETTMTEFEITPPNEIAARRARRDEADAFCKLDDSPDGLFARIKEHAESLVPEVEIKQSAWEPFARDLAGRLEAEMAKNPVPLTPDQKLDLRKKGVDEFFDRLANAMTKVPQKYQEPFTRFCLDVGYVPAASTLYEIQHMIDDVKDSFRAILNARDEREARKRLDDLGAYLQETDSRLRSDSNPKARTFVMAAQELSMRLGALDLMDEDNPEAFARTLTRTGPFLDMLHTLAHQAPGNEAEFAAWTTANVTMRLFKNGLDGILPDDVLNKFDTYNNPIRERDLSLSRQRARLGEGKHLASMPGWAVLNPEIARYMSAMQKRVREHVGEYCGRMISPDNSDWESDQISAFENMYSNHGVFVNGRHYHSEPIATSDSSPSLIDVFVDDRTALQLFMLAGQSPTSFFKVAEKVAWDETMNKLDSFFNETGSEQARLEQQVRIDVLNDKLGLYRITAFSCLSTDNPKSAPERCMHEVSVDVNLGAPGANRKPSVESARVDVLIRGREDAPGEE